MAPCQCANALSLNGLVILPSIVGEPVRSIINVKKTINKIVDNFWLNRNRVVRYRPTEQGRANTHVIGLNF